MRIVPTIPTKEQLETLYAAFLLQHGSPKGLGAMLKQSVSVGNKAPQPLFRQGPRDSIDISVDFARFSFMFGLAAYMPRNGGDLEYEYRQFLHWYTDTVEGR